MDFLAIESERAARKRFARQIRAYVKSADDSYFQHLERVRAERSRLFQSDSTWEPFGVAAAAVNNGSYFRYPQK